MDEKLKKYPKTEKFEVVDTIGVPHPYCITPKHLLPDRMVLNAASIAEAERLGAKCDICRIRVREKLQERVLSYGEHEQALLVEVDDKRELKDIPELKDYLLGIKAMAEADKFAGFAFKRKSIIRVLKDEVKNG